MRFYQMLDDRQSETGSAGASGTRLIDAVESFEDTRQILLRNADARIGDPDADRIVLFFLHAVPRMPGSYRLGPERRPSALGRIGDRGAEHIHDDLTQPVFVSLEEDAALDIRLQPDMLGRRLRCEQFNRLTDER